MEKKELLKSMRGSLIVSCQALPGEPLYMEESSVMYLMARAAKQAGAKAIRTSGVRDVMEIKEETGLPIIGLIKKHYEGYDAYITPTMVEVDELISAKADIIALDATDRRRGDRKSVHEFIRDIKSRYPHIILMADISTVGDGIAARDYGVDIVGTTLSGYTPCSLQNDEPDYRLVETLAASLDIPVIAEGKIHYPWQARRMLKLGAHAVVVGGAITRPLEIAGRFVKELEG